MANLLKPLESLEWFSGIISSENLIDEPEPLRDDWLSEWNCPEYVWDDVWFLIVGCMTQEEISYWWDDEMN
jgi:hypothetical protein